MYLKNTASQKLEVFAFDYTTGAPKTGDAANITAYVNIDEAGYSALGDTSASEVDSTNKKGLYLVDLAQAETNGTKLGFFAKSSTANVSCICRPAVSFTQPTAGLASPTNITAATGITVSTNSDKTGYSVTGLTASDVGAIKTKTDFLPSATAGAAGGLFIAGTNAATTITTALTTTFTGNLTGSVASVTGAVGSVTGAVGSVTGLTASNLDATITSRLAPTVAGRTLDVSATGEAGLDWANIGSPTTSVNLSGTLISTSQQVASTAVCGSLIANADKTGYFLDSTVIASIWTLANAIETGVTPAKALQRIGAVAAGKISGAGTGTEVFLGLDGATTRVTVTVDSSGNRTAVVYA